MQIKEKRVKRNNQLGLIFDNSAYYEYVVIHVVDLYLLLEKQDSLTKNPIRSNMSNKPIQLLQDPFLNALRKEHIPVSIYLVNGIKLQGNIESFDQYVVLLRNTVTQMVYKHAISTIVPARAVEFRTEEISPV